MIVCPTMLRDQWEREIRRWIEFAAVDFWPYVVGPAESVRKGFWKMYHHSTRRPWRRIILVTEPVSGCLAISTQRY